MSGKVDELAEQWSEVNKQRIMNEEWKRLRDELAALSENPKRYAGEFLENMPIQKLNPNQISYLRELADGARNYPKMRIDIRQYDDNIINRTNVLSRTQKIELENKLLQVYEISHRMEDRKHDVLLFLSCSECIE